MLANGLRALTRVRTFSAFTLCIILLVKDPFDSLDRYRRLLRRPPRFLREAACAFFKARFRAAVKTYFFLAIFY